MTVSLEQYLINMYGEPSYHMNIRCVAVQYNIMRTNPERFIESIAGDSWARYLADMSQQGTQSFIGNVMFQSVYIKDVFYIPVLLILVHVH